MHAVQHSFVWIPYVVMSTMLLSAFGWCWLPQMLSFESREEAAATQPTDRFLRRWHSLGWRSIGICLSACFSACAALSLKMPQDFLVPSITADQGSCLLLFNTSWKWSAYKLTKRLIVGMKDMMLPSTAHVSKPFMKSFLQELWGLEGQSMQHSW